jgi:hypothetical protein
LERRNVDVAKNESTEDKKHIHPEIAFADQGKIRVDVK